MESESSREASAEPEGNKSAKGKKKDQKDQKDEGSGGEIKAPTGTPHSASAKLAKRTLFPTTPASYSDDDSSHGAGRKKRRKYTTNEKQQITGIHLSERQQVLLLKTFAAENSPKASSPALSVASSTQGGTYSASSGTDRLHKRNIRGETLLHVAAYRGDVKQVAELIEQGLDVNSLDNADWTPLHEACNKGYAEAARVLLQHGAIVNAKGNDDITPLHDAAGSGSADLVKLLLEHGADPNMRDKTGRYPIDMPSSLTIVNIIKSWPTYKAIEESSDAAGKNETDFLAADSPRINSSVNVVSPGAHSVSPSTYDSAPQTLNADQESEHRKTSAISPSGCSSTSTVKQLNESESHREPPPLSAVSAGDDESVRGDLSVDMSEENPPPPLLTPQLPDDNSSVVEKCHNGTEKSVPQRNTPSPLLPPCLQPAVSNLPALETLASSPPLVVITEDDVSNKAAKSGELLLKVVTTEMQPKSSTTGEGEEQPTPETEDDTPKSSTTKLEPTVATSRTRRKVTSKEAPASSSAEDKQKAAGGFRKRLGSVGVVSPGNKDSSSSNSAESNAKIQPLRKRLVTRSEDDGDKQTGKEKKKNAGSKEKEKEKPSNDTEQAQHVPDPYEFVEEPDAVVDAATQQLAAASSTPTSSPRNSVSHTSPAKQAAKAAAETINNAINAGTTQSSPSISSTKTNGSGSRRTGHRSRRASSPSESLTPNEMKLPPLKIRLNRGAHAVAEAGRQSESESSVSSTYNAKAETEDVDEQSRTDIDSNTGRVKEEPEGTMTGDEDTKKEQTNSEKDSNIGNSNSVPPRKRKVRGSGTSSPVGQLSIVTNTPGGGTSPVVSPSSIPTQEQVAQFFNIEKPRVPNYIRQWQNARKWAVERRRQQTAPVQLPSIPRGVGDFLMIRKGYLLAADGGQQIMTGLNPNQETQPPQPPTSLALNTGSNSGTTFSSGLPPPQQPSPTLPPSLQALFRSQEEARHRLRMQHRVEQEKLVLSYEQEVLRAYVHRELAATQAQPLSVCAFFSDANLAAHAPVEALINGQINAGGANPLVGGSSNGNNSDVSAQQRALRLNNRHQRPRLDDLDEKFTRLADTLLQRQRHEAAATRAVQAAEWSWRSEIVNQMSANDIQLTQNDPPANQPLYQSNSTTVPLIEVPMSLPIPRLI